MDRPRVVRRGLADQPLEREPDAPHGVLDLHELPAERLVEPPQRALERRLAAVEESWPAGVSTSSVDGRRVDSALLDVTALDQAPDQVALSSSGGRRSPPRGASASPAAAHR